MQLIFVTVLCLFTTVYISFSAKNGTNVHDAFKLLVRKVLENPTIYTPRIKNPGVIKVDHEEPPVPEQPLPNNTAPTTTSEQQMSTGRRQRCGC